jgi:hypothetical protein
VDIGRPQRIIEVEPASLPLPSTMPAPDSPGFVPEPAIEPATEPAIEPARQPTEPAET